MVDVVIIKIPHATINYKIYSDDISFLQTLIMYYGSLVEEKDIPNCTEIYYINGVYTLPGTEIKYTYNCNEATCSTIMYIREHICLEEDWFMYHASCSNVGGQTYLFVGKSGAGKTTLTTFLHFQENTSTVSEDMCIVNYKTLEVVPINRPFFLRPKSFQLLSNTYNIPLSPNLRVKYNLNEKIQIAPNTLTLKNTFKIDAVVFLNLNFDKFYVTLADFTALLESSYNALDVYKNVCSTMNIYKKVPFYNMFYYDLKETFHHLSNWR